MPYQINRTDGTLLTTIQDHTRDSETTSLTLLGRGSVDYGKSVAENFIHVMENFSAPVPPANPLQGQLWYHTFDPGPPVTLVNKLKIYDGTGWVNAGGATSSVNPPDNPEPGDLWYNLEDNTIYYWDGSNWKKVGGPHTGLTPGTDPKDLDPNVPLPPPPVPEEGDLWWMLPERKLWAYDSAFAGAFPPNTKRVDGSAVPNGWILIGPDGTRDPDNPGGGSYTETVKETVTDPLTGEEIEIDLTKVIVDGVLVAVWSGQLVELLANNIGGHEFGAWYNINGLDESSLILQPGLNMNNDLQMFMNGQASDSERLNGLNGSQFLRSDETTYPITQDIVFDLGTPDQHWRRFYARNIYAGTSNGDTEEYDIEEVNIFGKASAAELADASEKAVMFTEPKVLKTETTGSDVEINFTDLFATAANEYVGTATLTQEGIDKVVEITKDEIGEIISQLPSGSYVPLDASSEPTGAHNLGSAGSKWGTVFATEFNGLATQAKYADMAERYEADTIYAPGTLLSLGGDKEVTITNGAYDYNFFGVVSTRPGFILNAETTDERLNPAIALTGRVPVRVIGEVKKGQRLILSSTLGVAEAYEGNLEEVSSYFIVGRALEDKEDAGVGLVMAVVQAK